ncbi:hypothetical protein G7043_17550 [Lentzea sp. NEAU-D13]|uniref:Uncharacterized protein n=1 Tax=Lentzea alba TaxID=2714351 RepID=A0A7C9VWC9_9PSEU|nr:hypothetical protein [Lentzea alba]NGY60738.1 hypothetical protein [Lentzea alba]
MDALVAFAVDLGEVQRTGHDVVPGLRERGAGARIVAPRRWWVRIHGSRCRPSSR